MTDAPRADERRSARYAIYGAFVGLVAGVGLGAWASSHDWWVPTLQPTIEVTRDPGPLRSADPRHVFNLDGLVIPLRDILHGGPPKDGIPALDAPAMLPAPAAALDDDDRIVVVTIAGATRAYPIRLLSYHEIVNDELGGTPFAVVYCPLCDSVSVFDRRVNGATLAFGVSGLLFHSNILMYDRTDEALWTQLGGRALSGPHANRMLTHLNTWTLTTYGAWSTDIPPEARVASFETGHTRDYARIPYADYFETDDIYFPIPRDDRLARRKEPVVGIRLDDAACAIPLSAIEQAPAGRLEVPIAGSRVILARTMESGNVTIVDAPENAMVTHTFWFAWAAFYPETTIFGHANAATQPAAGH